MTGAQPGPPPHEALADALRGFLGTDIGLGWADPGAPPEGLLSAESTATAAMRPARLREFAAGRRAARAAMAALGLPPHPVPMAKDRAPIWPKGLLGTISHGAGLCVAALAPVGARAPFGIDIEPAAPLPQDLWGTILTPDETRLVVDDTGTGGSLAALRVFSAKEAVYKAQYPLTGRLLSFQDVALTDLPGPRATIARILPLHLDAEVVSCRVGGVILSQARLLASQPPRA